MRPAAAVGRAVSARDADVRAAAGAIRGATGNFWLCSSSNGSGLARSEGDDAPDRIVRRDADGHSISWNHLDAEAAHSTAQLGQHFVAGVALHAIESAAVHRNHRALHVN